MSDVLTTKKTIVVSIMLFIVFGFVTIAIASTQLITGVSGTISAGSSRTFSSLTATYDNAKVVINPSSYGSNEVYERKSWVVVQKKSGNSYTTKLSKTVTLGITGVDYLATGEVGAGTWRAYIRQYSSSSSSTKYISVTGSFGIYSYS